jgi:hypothetical protein
MIESFLDSLPLWALGTVIVGGCIAFGTAVTAVAHRAGWTLTPADVHSATVLHALVSVVYAVVTGLIVVAVQEDHTRVRQAAIREAAALGDMHRDLAGLRPDDAGALRARVSNYVRLVIADEWPALQSGRQSDAAAGELEALASRLITLHPDQPSALVVQRTLIDRLDAVSDARTERVFLGLHGINRATWAVVILGAAVTMGFGGLFPIGARQRAVVMAMTATMFGLLLFLMVATSPPLRGRLGVGPEAFVELEAELAAQPQTR